jgi:hypothetical protein
MKVFSYCIYDYDLKYYLGLIENIKLINEYYPDYYIYIYYGINCFNNLLEKIVNIFKNIKIFPTNQNGFINTFIRYKPVLYDDVEITIIRDADSEVNERDRWCINDFLLKKNNDNNKYYYNTIRDHYWHKNNLLAGMSMLCKNDINYIQLKEELNKIFIDIESKEHNYTYGCDEIILKEKIYPIIKDNFFVYTNICSYNGEKSQFIDYPNNNINFIGNVVEYIIPENFDINLIDDLLNLQIPKKYKFRFNSINVLEQIYWLDNQKRLDVMVYFIKEIFEIQNIQSEYREYENINTILHYDFIANYYTHNIQGCMRFFNRLYKYNITDTFKNNANYFYELASRFDYKIIGTCDTNYEPKNKEIVIYYGNYADDYLSLPQSYKIYKNIVFYQDVKLDKFISDECWNSIDKIYIMTVDVCYERQYDVLTQLCLMNAPLDKVHMHKVTKDKELNDIYIGVTKNHLDCLEHMKNNNLNNCLFLEDDFIFSSNYNDNKIKLKTFFERKYDYDICFLAASKYHHREDLDDLLIISKQICTTSSAYFVSKKNINKVYDVVKEGFELLIQNKDNSEIFCIDRYWHKISKDNKMFIFKNKLGFQKPSVSKILNKLNINLD